jgi:hypothetical protein
MLCVAINVAMTLREVLYHGSLEASKILKTDIPLLIHRIRIAHILCRGANLYPERNPSDNSSH